MKRKLTPIILLVTGVGMANAATVIGDGAESPFASGGNPDGWSGVSVMETAILDSNTDGGLVEVTQVSMLAGAGRAAGTHHLQAILVDSNNLIAWISPELTPTVDGLNVFPISGAGTIDATAGDLRLGVWQWNDGVDDSAGGTVAFAGGGGGGMFQQNLNGTLGAGAISIGQAVTSGHASGAGGRDYHISVTVSAIPEPSVFPLIALSGLGLLLRRRRS
ncbi:MAG: PEP-CTERM sorting domain-containing protein [Roseibacillus sp.]|nr:PEP-CTERM sorting domain-containing protein [Roseibacillus sp.]